MSATFTLILMVALGAAAPATAADYKVVCLQPFVQDEPVGPKTCVPVPIEP